MGKIGSLYKHWLLFLVPVLSLCLVKDAHTLLTLQSTPLYLCTNHGI